MTATTATRPTEVSRKSRAMAIDVEDGVAIITMDLPNEPVNKLNRAVKDDFIELIRRLDGDASIQRRAHQRQAGHVHRRRDIEEFLEVDRRGRRAIVARRSSLLDSWRSCGRPSSQRPRCLHGCGLEAALACAWRIGTDHPKTVLAFPR